MTEHRKNGGVIDIGTLIGQSVDALELRDALALRRVSADALSEAAIEGHRELILLALVDYALSKILSKTHYRGLSGKFYSDIKRHFIDARAGPKAETIKHLERIEDLVIKLDTEEGNYSENVIEKAKVKKGAKLYEQGLSLRRASELTGADPVAVLHYVGGSKIHEFKASGKSADRLETARRVFT